MLISVIVALASDRLFALRTPCVVVVVVVLVVVALIGARNSMPHDASLTLIYGKCSSCFNRLLLDMLPCAAVAVLAIATKGRPPPLLMS
jgi:hypothetical protein